MKTVRLTVTWRSEHVITVPDDATCPWDLGTLMDLVVADPESGGDLTSETAELVDWGWTE